MFLLFERTTAQSHLRDSSQMRLSPEQRSEAGVTSVSELIRFFVRISGAGSICDIPERVIRSGIDQGAVADIRM